MIMKIYVCALDVGETMLAHHTLLIATQSHSQRQMEMCQEIIDNVAAQMDNARTTLPPTCCCCRSFINSEFSESTNETMMAMMTDQPTATSVSVVAVATAVDVLLKFSPFLLPFGNGIRVVW